MEQIEDQLVSLFGEKEEYSSFDVHCLRELEKVKQRDIQRYLLLKYLDIDHKLTIGGADYIVTCWERLASTSCEYEEQLNSIYKLTPIQVYNIVRVLGRQTQKVNTLCFHGTSDAGKSLLARSILSPWEPGSIQRDGGMNVHWLENTLQRNFLLWEEPIVNCEIKEDLKLILSGERITVNPKGKPIVYKEKRSPLIITCNSQWWLIDQTNAYVNRMYLLSFHNKVSSHIDKLVETKHILRYLLNLYGRFVNC